MSRADPNPSCQAIIQAGLIKEGQTVLLDYGPRGKPKRQWKGTFRKDGIEVDGKIMSLSAAAVYCIQKAGGQRETANGWIMWKTEDGTYLTDFYDKLLSIQAKDENMKTVQQSADTDSLPPAKEG